MIPRKPYLIRALCEWAEDNAWTPMIVVSDGPGVVVPPAQVKDGKITLNISLQATRDREIDRNGVRALARFAGEIQRLQVPLDAVDAFLVRETGEGMLFPPEAEPPDSPPEPEPSAPPPRRAHLKVVK